jgi:hypothetical protein
VLLKVAAIVALATLAVYVLTSAAGGRGMAWGDIPTWVTGAGTVGALFVAFYQIGQERKRRIAQEAEDRHEQRVAQARLIAAWLGNPRTPQEEDASIIQLVNGSPEPVYDVFASVVFVSGAAPHTTEDWLKGAMQAAGQMSVPMKTFSVLPPGRWSVSTHLVDSVMTGRHAAEVGFTDRAGRHWIRRATGALDELDVAPKEYLERYRGFWPYDLGFPNPES